MLGPIVLPSEDRSGFFVAGRSITMVVGSAMATAVPPVFDPIGVPIPPRGIATLESQFGFGGNGCAAKTFGLIL
jgi:hypothetical protein